MKKSKNKPRHVLSILLSIVLILSIYVPVMPTMAAGTTVEDQNEASATACSAVEETADTNEDDQSDPSSAIVETTEVEVSTDSSAKREEVVPNVDGSSDGTVAEDFEEDETPNTDVVVETEETIIEETTGPPESTETDDTATISTDVSEETTETTGEDSTGTTETPMEPDDIESTASDTTVVTTEPAVEETTGTTEVAETKDDTEAAAFDPSGTNERTESEDAEPVTTDSTEAATESLGEEETSEEETSDSIEDATTSDGTEETTESADEADTVSEEASTEETTDLEDTETETTEEVPEISEATYSYDLGEANFVSLSSVLEKLGITGIATAVRSSNDAVMTVSDADGDWMITVADDYTSGADLIVTIDDVEFVIHVTAQAEEVEEPTEVSFDQTQKAGDYMVQVTADAGVFPEGATLSVRILDAEEAKRTEDLVASQYDSSVTVARCIALDISVLDAQNNEIEPDTSKGSVRVAISAGLIADPNLSADLFHVTDDGSVSKLPAERSESTLAARTDSFSTYVLNFPYGDLSYSMGTSRSADLSSVLKALNLIGEVQGVTSSDGVRLTVAQGDNGTWTITAADDYTSGADLIVTIGGIDYVISVTAVITAPATSGNAYAVLDTEGTLTFIRSDTGAEGNSIKDTQGNVWTGDYIYAVNETRSGRQRWWYQSNLIRKVRFQDVIHPVSTKNWFNDCNHLTEMDLTNLDTSGTSSFENMFKGCSSLSSIDLSPLTVSHPTSLAGMFYGCSSLASLDLSNFQADGNTIVDNMITGCQSLTSITFGSDWKQKLFVTDLKDGIWTDLNAYQYYSAAELQDFLNSDAFLAEVPVTYAWGMIQNPSAEASGTPNVIESLTVNWVNDNGTVYNLDDAGINQITPTYDAILENTEKAVKIQVSYNMSGGTENVPGTIALTLPAHLFRNRDGQWADTIDLGIPNVSEISNVSASDNAFAYSVQNDTVTVMNVKTVQAASHFTFDVTYTLNANSSRYIDKSTGSFQASMKITNAATEEEGTKQSPILTAQINTNSVLEQVLKKGKQYNAWQEDWGEECKPENTEDFFYVVWKCRAYVKKNSTQLFELNLVDSPSEGEILGYHGILTELPDNNPDKETYDDSDFTKVPTAVEGPVNKELYYVTYVLTSYPKAWLSDGTSHTLKNHVEYTLTNKDSGTANTLSADATLDLKPLPAFVPPTGEMYFLDKAGKGLYAGYITMLENNSVTGELEYTNFAHADNMALHTATEADSGYENVPYIVELIDDLFYLEDDTYAKELTSEDYYISSIGPNDNNRYRNPLLYRYVLCQHYGINDSQTAYTFSDYTDEEMSTIQYAVYANKDNGDWVKIADIQGAQRDGNDGAVVNETITPYNGASVEDRRIILPENTYTGVKLVLTTSASRCYLALDTRIRLKPSDTVKTAVSGKNAFRVVDENTLAVYDEAGTVLGYKAGDSNGATEAHTFALDQAKYGVRMYHAVAADTINRLNSYSLIEKKAEYYSNDTRNKQIDIQYWMRATEVTVLPDDDIESWLAQGAFQLQTNGTFYDLLPRDVVPDLSTINVYPSNIDGNAFENDPVPDTETFVQLVPDWRDTGRTMMIVKVFDDDPQYYTTYSKETTGDSANGRGHYGTGYYVASGYTMTFTATYSWTSLADYGSKLINSVAYESGNDAIADGFADCGQDGTLGGDNGAFIDLDDTTDAAKFLYAQTSTQLSVSTSAETSLSKAVRKNGDTEWVNGQTTPINLHANESYQYRLRSGAAGGSTVSDMILYDSIENYVPVEGTADYGQPQWRGTLESIDVSQLISRGIAPVIYYSTEPNLDISAHSDLSDPVWTETAPNLSAVTAIAVDMRKANDGSDYVLPEKTSVVVILNMRTPTDEAVVDDYYVEGAHAYNQVYMYKTLTAQDQTKTSGLYHNEYTKVGLLPYVGHLSLKKVEKNEEGEEVEDTENSFTFHVKRNGTYLSTDYRYTVTGTDGTMETNQVGEDGSVLLRAGQTADFFGPENHGYDGLMIGTFEIIEEEAEGFTTTVNIGSTEVVSRDSGAFALNRDDTVTVTFTNTVIPQNEIPPETPITPPETPETPTTPPVIPEEPETPITPPEIPDSPDIPETPPEVSTPTPVPYSTKATLTVHKTLDGKAPGDAAFSFVLRDANGITLQTVTNSKDGTVSFDPLPYSNDDIGKTYTYTISEVNDGRAQYNFDSGVCTVSVVLRDTGNDTMSADVSYSGTATFANTTKPEETEEKTTTTISEDEPPTPAETEQAPETTSVSVQKIWKDNENQAGFRPESISVKLYGDGIIVGNAVILSSSNNWSYTWTDLKTGVNYSIDEAVVPEHYQKEITGSATKGFVITNRVVAEEQIDFEAESDDTWSDEDESTIFEETDENVVTDDTPQTGDDSNLSLWIFLIIVGGSTLIDSILYRRRDKR